MNMKQRQQLQVAYLQEDLITASDFVSYCGDNGIETDLNELEFFDKHSLIVPALRVSLGYRELRKIYAKFDGRNEYEWRQVDSEDLDKFDYKKIDPKSYYIRGGLVRDFGGMGEIRGFHYGDEDWLDWYENNQMISLPSSDGYIAWKNFEGGEAFSSNKKEFLNVGYLMYAKHQIYTVKIAQQARSILLKNQAFYRDKKTWAIEGPKISEIILEGYKDEVIRKKVLEFNDFLALLVDIRKLRIGKNRKTSEAYINVDKEFAIDDAKEEAEFYDKEAKNKATEILKKHNFDLDKIYHWRYVLLQYGTFANIKDSNKLRAYVSRLDSALLSRTEDTYNFVNIISWFIELIGGEGITVHNLLLRDISSHCEICGKSFTKKRYDQVTCGDVSCKKEHQLRHKKKMRRTGVYTT